jgi:hypothetical protein
MQLLEGTEVARFTIAILSIQWFYVTAPTFADQPSLPRLQAFISEALRWRPAAPNGKYPRLGPTHEIYKILLAGVIHQTTQDVIWVRNLRMTYCVDNNVASGKLLHPSWDCSHRQPLVSNELQVKIQRSDV